MRKRKGKKRIPALLAALLVLASGTAEAGTGEWISVNGESEPETYWFPVQEYTGTVRMTFLGDCTLGGEEKNSRLSRSFISVIRQKGETWPFRNLTVLTAEDDLTVANLEGVLSDRELPKVDKTYNFIGPTAFTGILTAGSVECVTLANNHSHDYDNAGFSDTKKALAAANVACFDTENAAVWRNEEGLMIGFLGVSGSLSGSRAKIFRHQAELLKSMGCAALIVVMHAGTEYAKEPDSYQRQIVSRALECGANLIVGHHPHVAQGFEMRDGVPVVYSLGNCAFGGNFNPRDPDALVLQAELSFRDGVLTDIALHFHPISVSGEAGSNDYSPVLLTGEDAERVLNKMRISTGSDPGSFRTGEGAVVTVRIR